MADWGKSMFVSCGLEHLYSQIAFAATECHNPRLTLRLAEIRVDMHNVYLDRRAAALLQTGPSTDFARNVPANLDLGGGASVHSILAN